MGLLSTTTLNKDSMHNQKIIKDWNKSQTAAARNIRKTIIVLIRP